MASALFEAQRASLEAVAVWTVHIYFPAFELLSAKDFRWATGQGIELEDGFIYEQRLTDIPKGRHQRGRGNDYAEFTASNPDYALYQELLPYQDLIEKAEVTIAKAYEITKDLWESEIQFFGYLKDFTLDDTDKTFKFTAFADISRSGFPVGGRILTRERCGTEFNFNGVADPTYHICGWQTAQGGNATFCSKKKKGVDGCAAHNNLGRFFAVEGLSTADVQITTNGLDGSGWDYGTDRSCFAEEVCVLMADWKIKPIVDVRAGMQVMGLDIFAQEAVRPTKVFSRQKTLVQDVWLARFDKGHAKVRVRKNHLFYIGKLLFAPVGRLNQRPVIGMDIDRNPAKSRLTAIERVVEEIFVYNLHTETGTYIICDTSRQFYYFVHNEKPLMI